MQGLQISGNPKLYYGSHSEKGKSRLNILSFASLKQALQVYCEPFPNNIIILCILIFIVIVKILNLFSTWDCPGLCKVTTLQKYDRRKLPPPERIYCNVDWQLKIAIFQKVNSPAIDLCCSRTAIYDDAIDAQIQTNRCLGGFFTPGPTPATTTELLPIPHCKRSEQLVLGHLPNKWLRSGSRGQNHNIKETEKLFCT